MATLEPPRPIATLEPDRPGYTPLDLHPGAPSPGRPTEARSVAIPLPVVARAAAGPTEPSVSPPPAAPETDQHSPDGTASDAAPPPLEVQRSDDGGASPAPSGPGGAGAEHGGGGGPSDADLDDLSRKLYGRLVERLKAELYLDRERAGLLSDLTA